MTASSNNKTSLVVASQLPSFIQDDYQTFVAFLEAYYEFLEQEGGTSWAREKLSEAFDIDATLDAFLARFSDQYLTGFPSDMLADRATVIKNIKQFYLAKGSEKSIKFLFRALFGEDITIFYPNRSILKVSDGKWVKQQALRITGDLLNLFAGDGVTNEFIISDEVNSKANLTVFINDVQISPNLYSLNVRSLSVNTAIGTNDELKVEISGGDYGKFVGQQIFGSTTGAAAIVEKYNVIYDKGQFYNELTITDLSKAFMVGEDAYTLFVDDENNVSIKIAVPITSSVIDVEITYGGAFYNIGDPLIFTSNTGSGAQAFVATVYKSGIKSVEALSRGAGFQPGAFFTISGGGGTGAVISMNGIDSSGNVHPNTYNVTSDILHTYANTHLNANTFGFPAFANANINTLMSSAFSHQIYGLCGPIDPTEILIVIEGENYVTTPTIKMPVPIFTVNVSGNTANISMTDFGILGSLKIINAGVGYQVGDEIVFTNIPSSTGQDGAAAVTAISATGGIAKIDFQPPRITGFANVTSGSNVVTGVGTAFANNISANATIMINNESQVVKTITSANSLVTYGTWTNSANLKALGVFGKNFIGGSGYQMDSLPLASVSSLTGSNANITVNAIIGDGDDVRVNSLQPVGRIRTITVSQGGENYLEEPSIDMSHVGDGTANLKAEIAGGLFEYPGVYKNEDGLISGSNKIHDRDFYQFYSYVIKSKTTLDKYQKILKDLVHPAGMKQFAEVESDMIEIPSNISVQEYQFLIDDETLHIVVSGHASVSKHMSYVIVPGHLRPGGSSFYIKKKSFKANGEVKVAGTSSTTTLPVSFFAPLISTANLSFGNASPVFTRSSNASVQDSSGTVFFAIPGEIRFQGARRVQNLLQFTESWSNTFWSPANAGAGTLPVITAGYTGITAPDGTTNGMLRLQCNLGPASAGANLNAGNSSFLQSAFSAPNTQKIYGKSVWARSTDGVSNYLVALKTVGGIGTMDTIMITPTWQRLSTAPLTGANGGPPFVVGLRGTGSFPIANTCDIVLWHPQLEEIGGKDVLYSSEYVSNDAILNTSSHGANVSGVQYFDYENGNYVLSVFGITTSNCILIEQKGPSFNIYNRKRAVILSANSAVPKQDNVSWFSTGHSANQVISGLFEIRAKLKTDWAQLQLCNIIAKDGAVDNTRSYGLEYNVSGAGKLRYITSFDGKLSGANTFGVDANIALIQPLMLANTTIWVNVVHNCNSGLISFGYSFDENTWFSLGNSTVNIGNPYVANNTRTLIGSRDKSPFGEQFIGTIFRVKEFINGNMILDFHPNDYSGSGNTFISANTGEQWTLNGNATIYNVLPRGYYPEDTRTSLFLRSSDLGNTSIWGNTGSAPFRAAANGPEGIATAIYLNDTDNTNFSGIFQSVSGLSQNSYYIFSIWIAKTGGVQTSYPEFQFQANNNSNTSGSVVGYIINTTNGAMVQSLSSPTDSTFGVISFNDKFWQAWIRGNTGNATFVNCVIYPSTSIDGVNQTASAIGGAVFWNPQLESSGVSGDGPSMPIKTESTTVTYSRDNLKYSSNGLFVGSQGGVVFETFYDKTMGSSTYGMFTLNDTTSTNRIQISAESSGIFAIDTTANANSSTSQISGLANNVLTKVSARWSNTFVGVYANGNAATPNTSNPTVPPSANVNTVWIGAASNGSNVPKRYTIRNVRGYLSPPTNTQMIIYTSP